MPKNQSKHRANTLQTVRSADKREPYKRFLIVCEGQRTEPNYFEKYRFLLRRQSEVVTVDVVGTGYNTISLVDEALRQAEEKHYDVKNDDEVWCVFDRDSFSKQDFHSAIELANKNGFHVAYSNQAFELWYLLHFNYYDTAFSRETYKRRLTKLLGHEYIKNSSSMYDELNSKQANAIRNAERLLASHDEHLPPADKEPSTTVHLLVQSLNRNFLPR